MEFEHREISFWPCLKNSKQEQPTTNGGVWQSTNGRGCSDLPFKIPAFFKKYYSSCITHQNILKHLLKHTYSSVYRYVACDVITALPAVVTVLPASLKEGPIILLFLKNVGSTRLRESDLHLISPKTPAPQYQPIDRKKRKGKRVEDYSRDRAA